MIDDVEVVENIRRARPEKRMAWTSSIIAGVVFMVASAVLGHNLLIGTVFVTAGMAGVCSAIISNATAWLSGYEAAAWETCAARRMSPYNSEAIAGEEHPRSRQWYIRVVQREQVAAS